MAVALLIFQVFDVSYNLRSKRLLIVASYTADGTSKLDRLSGYLN